MTTERLDPVTVLRRIVAAYEELQAAYTKGNDPAAVDAAQRALGTQIEQARQTIDERWRREHRERRERQGR